MKAPRARNGLIDSSPNRSSREIGLERFPPIKEPRPVIAETIYLLLSANMNDEKGTESSLPKGSVQEDRIAELSRKGLVRRSLLFLGIVLIGVLLDLGSKSWIFSALGMPGEYKYRDDPELHATWWIAEDLFGFQTSLNQGALFRDRTGESRSFRRLFLCCDHGNFGLVDFFSGIVQSFSHDHFGNDHGGDSRKSLRSLGIARLEMELRRFFPLPAFAPDRRSGLRGSGLDPRDDRILSLAEFQHCGFPLGLRGDPHRDFRFFRR